MVITPQTQLTPRTCRYGHGPLQLEPGHWGLGELNRKDSPGAPDYSMGSTQFIVRLYNCTTCGYLEMFNLPVEAL